MKADEAVRLLENGIENSHPQIWADLGCGSGTFTFALSQILKKSSEIIGIDTMSQRFPERINDVKLKFKKANFETDTLVIPKLDGILMANSFHFIKKKEELIYKLENFMKDEKRFLIIEYESSISNPWVPYPINFQKIKTLFENLSYSKIVRLDELNSKFGGKIYSTLLIK